MAHPYQHALNSVQKYGGIPDDYLAIHQWFDASKAHLALPSHRAVRHHSAGIFEAETVFGVIITNAAGHSDPVYWRATCN